MGCATIPPAPPAAPSSLSVGDTNIVALAVPAPSSSSSSQQSLIQFLGLDKIFGGLGNGLNQICTRIKSSLGLTGKFPGLQPKPAVAPITDPANSSDKASPAVQAAAKVKAEQDQADQKIQAIRYLATVGCGECYPEVEDSLLAALDDCTESVRYEAIKALRGEGKAACGQCSPGGGCCSKKVQDKLSQLVNDYKKDGARVEPSQRIRRLARIILQNCGPPKKSDGPNIPSEGPSSSADDKKEQSTPTVAILPKANTRSQSSIAFPDPQLCVGYLDNQPIQAWELDSYIRNQLAKLNIHQFDELSPSVRATIIEEALEQAMLKQLKKEIFVSNHLAIAEWNDEYNPRLNQWFNDELLPPPKFSEKEVLDWYQNHIDDYTKPTRIKWEKASITLDNSARFASAFNTLEYLRLSAEGVSADKPKAFGKLKVDVVSYDLATVNEIPKELSSMLLTMPLGRTSEVIRVGDQLVLARVLDRIEEILVPLETAKPQILAQLKSEYLKQAEREWFQDTITKHSIWTIFNSKPPEIERNVPSQLANFIPQSKNSVTSNSDRIPILGSEIEKAPSSIVKAAFAPDTLSLPFFSAENESREPLEKKQNQTLPPHKDPLNGSLKEKISLPSDMPVLHNSEVEVRKKQEIGELFKPLPRVDFFPSP